MNDNLFFDPKQLGYCGRNVRIGRTVRIRYPELVFLHDDTIIDDFVYISTGLELNSHSAIEAGCVLMGGANQKITVGSYSCICSNSTLMCGTHDFKTGLHIIDHNTDVEQGLVYGDITIGDHVILGTKSTILPGITVQTGARIGAHSLVNKDLDAWNLYAGTPCRHLGEVDQKQVIKYLEDFKASY